MLLFAVERERGCAPPQSPGGGGGGYRGSWGSNAPCYIGHPDGSFFLKKKKKKKKNNFSPAVED